MTEGVARRHSGCVRVRDHIAALGLLAACAACDGTGLDGLGDVCTIAGSDRVMNFGTVEPGRARYRPFEIRNMSPTADCVVGPTRYEVLEDDGFFNPQPGPPLEPTRVVVAPQTTLAVPVGFRSAGPGTSRARYVIETSDPRRPTLTVELVRSTSQPGRLLVTPNALFFGGVAASCDAQTKTVTIFNPSGRSATVARLTVDGGEGAFTVVDIPSLPATLETGASLAVDVEFAPTAAGLTEGRLTIEGDVHGQPRTSTLALTGTGVVDGPKQVDDFELPSRAEYQILFLVDARPSMTGAREALSDAFGRLFESLGEANYRVAVMGTGADEGRFFPLEGPALDRVVTPESTPSPLEALRANLARVQSRDHVNAPLAAAYAALTPPNVTGPNAAFIQQRAPTDLVVLTDRADASPGALDFYANFLAALAGGSGPRTTFSAVTAGVDGCPPDGTIPDPPPRLAELAETLWGATVSLCGPGWQDRLFNPVRLGVPEEPRLFLTNQPIEGTIEVFVDDVRVDPTGPDGQSRWRYAFPTNEIQFVDAHAPPPGARVRVSYAPACP